MRLPDGQITLACQLSLAKSSPASKNILFFRIRKSPYIHPVPPTEGCFANVTNAGWDAVDVDGALDESGCRRTAKTCGPDASTPASSLQFSQATVATKPDHRGEHGAAVKTIARGVPGDAGVTVVT
jgi:hypothetical protein